MHTDYSEAEHLYFLNITNDKIQHDSASLETDCDRKLVYYFCWPKNFVTGRAIIRSLLPYLDSSKCTTFKHRHNFDTVSVGLLTVL